VLCAVTARNTGRAPVLCDRAGARLAPAQTGKAIRMATDKRARADAHEHGHDSRHGHGHDHGHGHHHRDVSGGWLRPAVFGAMDGLVTNVSLIAGVGGGGGSAHTIVLTGLAGLAAGACSMAAGEFVSVSSQNELILAEVDKERLELEHNAAFEQAELATMLRGRGVSAATARQAAAEISAQPEKALAVHALEELGVDPGELPSPLVAAGASLASFAVGALIPLIPYLAGLDVLGVALGLAAVAAVVGGGMVARMTDRPFWRGALRQLALGAFAVGITYLIGSLVGHVTG
jgi:vacuolar iron transporter family protein